jgi:uncharacterized protein (DUF58 family)
MIFRRVFAFLIRLVAIVIGAVFAAGLLLLGIVLTLTLITWALLRGRKPQVRRFKVDPRQPFGGFTRGGAAVDPANVVDVEAREVPAAPPRLDRS